MVCCACGSEAAALPTVRWRSGDRRFTLCNGCLDLPIRSFVWIVAGRKIVHGKCLGCDHWFSLRDLSEVRPGGKWDAISGLCQGCTSR